jgi:zinc protease
MAGHMMGGGFLNSRLANRIRHEDGLSYGVGGMINGHPVDPVGQFFAYAIYAPENAEALQAAFMEEIQKVLDEGFTEEELRTAVQGYLEGEQLSRAQDGSLSSQLSSNLYFDRTFQFSAEMEERIRSLTVDEVNAAVRRHLDPEKITIVKAGDFAGAEERIGVG